MDIEPQTTPKMPEKNEYADQPRSGDEKLPEEEKGNLDMMVGTTEDIQLDPVKEKKLLAKLDLAFVPIIMFAYLSCFLDRSNIG